MANIQLSNFKGFKSTVAKTQHWFTGGRVIDLTEAVYGKKPKSKGFNIIKWLIKIERWRRRFLLAVKIIKKLTKKAFKIGVKKLTRWGNNLGKKIVRKARVITRFLSIKKDTKVKSIKTKLGIIKAKIQKEILPKVRRFFNRHIRVPIRRVVRGMIKWFAEKWLKYAKPLVDAAKKYLFGGLANALKWAGKKLMNFTIIQKGVTAFNDAKGFVTKHGKKVKRLVSGGIELFSQKSKTIVSKVTGFGKDAKDFIMQGKDKIKAVGKDAVDKFKQAKKWFRVNKKLASKKAGKLASKFLNSRVMGWGKAVFKWFAKCIGILLKGAFALIKGVAGTVAGLFAAVTAGLSYLMPLILGLIMEFIMQKSGLLEKGISWARRGWRWLKYFAEVAMWCLPGGAGLLKSLGLFLLPFLPGIIGYFIESWFEKEEYYKSGLAEHDGKDVIFNSDTAQTIDNISDMQKSMFTSDIILARDYSKMVDDAIISLSNTFANGQKNRTEQFKMIASLA